MRRPIELALVLTIAVGAATALTSCKSKAPTQPEGEDFLAPPKPTVPAKAAGPAKFEGAGVVLPRGADVAGWKLKQGPEYYDTSNLYEVINGASAGYLAYGFKKMAKADYAPEGIAFKEDIVVEAYQMKDPLAAYGKWSEERSSCDPPDKDKPPGCSRGSDRILHKGDWFVKITTYDDTPAAIKELHKMAVAIDKRTPGKAEVPADAGRLPAKARKAHSVVYRPKSVLGIDGLGEGFQADYVEGDIEWSLFFKRVKSAPAAVEVLARLRNDAASPGFAKEGSKPEAVAGLGDEAVAVEATAGWILAARQGDQIAGGVEFASKDAAVASVRELLTPAASASE